MAEQRRAPRHPGGPPATLPKFDRIRQAEPAASRRRDEHGREALYSTAPSAGRVSQVEVRCRRCGVPVGLRVSGLLRLLVPPFLVDPFRQRLWVRCPACGRRSWLDVRAGATLRALLDR